VGWELQPFTAFSACDKIALLFGPYHLPALWCGERAFCLYRGAVVVIKSWSDAPLSWPRCRPVGGHGGGAADVVNRARTVWQPTSVIALGIDARALVSYILVRSVPLFSPLEWQPTMATGWISLSQASADGKEQGSGAASKLARSRITTMTSQEQLERDEVQRLQVCCAQEYLRRRQLAVPSPMLTLFWEEFHRGQTTRVISMVSRYFPDAHDRDDLIQEIWLAVTRKLSEFRWTANANGFRAWFAKLVHAKIVDLIRRRVRKRTANLGQGAWTVDEFLAGADVPETLQRRWQEDVIGTVLAELRAEVGEVNYQIVRERFWNNRTPAQIAAIVGLEGEQVSARLCRLLKKVRRRILACCGAEFTPTL
jgi:RNA polymerase sigma factor (sigma-70 family)